MLDGDVFNVYLVGQYTNLPAQFNQNKDSNYMPCKPNHNLMLLSLPLLNNYRIWALKLVDVDILNYHGVVDSSFPLINFKFW